MMFGLTPEVCEQCGLCVSSVIIEADGSVHSCYFYRTDDYLLGAVQNDSIERMLRGK